MSINKKQMDLITYFGNVLITVENEKFRLKKVCLYNPFFENYDKDLIIVANNKYFDKLSSDIRLDSFIWDTIPAHEDPDGILHCYRKDNQFDFMNDEIKGIIYSYGDNPAHYKNEFRGIVNKEYVNSKFSYLNNALDMLDNKSYDEALEEIKANPNILKNNSNNDFSKRLVMKLNRM